MAIVYNKFFIVLKEKGLNSNKLRTRKLMGMSTLQKLRSGGSINTVTINKICKMLNCQPGDIMEYVEDTEEPEEQPEE